MPITTTIRPSADAAFLATYVNSDGNTASYWDFVNDPLPGDGRYIEHLAATPTQRAFAPVCDDGRDFAEMSNIISVTAIIKILSGTSLIGVSLLNASGGTGPAIYASRNYPTALGPGTHTFSVPIQGNAVGRAPGALLNMLLACEYAAAIQFDVFAFEITYSLINSTQSESGTGQERAAVGVAGDDASTGTDAGAVETAVVASDIGFCAESATLERADGADVSGTQLGFGAESGVIVADIVATDTGAGAELAEIYITTPWFVREFGTGHECAHPANDSSLAADTGVGAESSVSGPWATDDGEGVCVFDVSGGCLAGETFVAVVSATPGVEAPELGTGVEDGLPAVSDPFSDAGTGSDSGSAAASIPVDQAATGTDTVSLLAETVFEVFGVGYDSAQLLGSCLYADAGTGSDSASARQDASTAESGGGTVSASVIVSVRATDTATGVEALDLLQEHQAGESAGGVEMLDPVADSIHIRLAIQLGTGVEHGVACTIGENWSMDAAIVSSDSGTGRDAGSPFYAASISDAGTGSDALLSGVALASTQTGSGTDAGVLGYAPAVAETGTGSDAATLTISGNFDAVASELGAAADALALVGGYFASDTGSGSLAGVVGIVAGVTGTGSLSATGVRTIAEPPESINVNLFSTRGVLLTGTPRRIDLFSSPGVVHAGQK